MAKQNHHRIRRIVYDEGNSGIVSDYICVVPNLVKDQGEHTLCGFVIFQADCQIEETIFVDNTMPITCPDCLSYIRMCKKLKIRGE